MSIVGDLSYTLFDPRVRVGGGKIAKWKILINQNWSWFTTLMIE
jgi:hypothetical protein